MYDVMVIGGGPAGVSAAIYAVRGGMKTVLFEKMYIGGQITSTSEMVNYAGFADPVSGVDFAEQMFEQMSALGVEIVYETVLDMSLEGESKQIKTRDNTYPGKTIVIASGANYKKLGLESEERFTGKGVSYCATCDGNFYKDKVVGMVGGGNHAVGEALYLTKMCRKVYVFNRGGAFKANEKLIDMLENNPKIQVLYHSQIEEILGEEHITGVGVVSAPDHSRQTIELEGLFVAIGRTPDVGFLNPDCLDTDGHIITNENMEIALHPGVFAAGDVRVKQLRQVATAVGDGAIAGDRAIEYVKKLDFDKKA